MNLRNRLMLMALVLVVAVMTVSTGVAYLILDRQSRAAAGDLLGKAFNLIEDELRAGRTKLAGGASQLTGVDKMPVKVKYVSEYAAKTKEPEIRPTYGEMLEALRGIVRANDLWKAAIYGADGALIAYAVSRPEGLLLGYSHPFPVPSHHGKLVKPGEELGIDAWAAGDLPSDGFAQKYPGQPPAAAGVGLIREGGFICLAARTPIAGKVYNRKTDAFEDKQLGLVVALTRLDQPLVERLARLTGTQVDIFTSQGLSVGSLPGLEQLPAGLESFTPGQAAGEERAEAGQGAVPNLGEVTVDQVNYYLAVQPLREGQQDLGAIACLYSKAIAQRNSGQMIRLLALAALVCVVLTLPAALVFAQRLSRPIDRAIGELTDMSHQMTAAAGEVSAASQALAENASSQAGSLEEVSAALAETTQVAQENQRHAQQADLQSRESIANLQSANQAMKGLMRSMQETSQASDSVIKVVQTIDGIAFQINLLALNAAVEAARAGSAGAGFAVVADEVRNLAMRSAEASQNTRQLLEEIIQRVRAGTQEVGNTDQLYGKVAVGVQAVTGLVGEIARASDEQLREVEQVGAAIQTINAGTQHSAASSQQSASASEQMSAQAAHMQGQIDILRVMIEGRKAARRERG